MTIAVLSSVVFFVLGVIIHQVFEPYLSSYSKEKGKRLATHEDFEQILAEQRRASDAVERVRAAISDEVWARQTVWRDKRDLYMRTFEALHEESSGYARTADRALSSRLNALKVAFGLVRQHASGDALNYHRGRPQRDHIP